MLGFQAGPPTTNKAAMQHSGHPQNTKCVSQEMAA
jgi:hypothetical protein